jgi:hypothetical protein
MSIKRYYGDNGELIRYEMRTRGARYARKQKIVNALIETALIVGSMSLLTVWYLINN